MKNGFKIFLWALKLGAPLNITFLALTFAPPLVSVDAHLLIPARILFAVSAFRCFFPVSYKDNIVFHDSPLSSIFLTRLLATFSELALITQLSSLLRLLNVDQLGWVDGLVWGMLGVVVLSQIFVWGQILTGRLELFFYEELGWAVTYTANTIVSLFLYTTGIYSGGRLLLLQLNLLFGAVYLPWQVIHLRHLLSKARQRQNEAGLRERLTMDMLRSGLKRAIRVRNPRSDARSWGGLVGAIWMSAYWASLIPIWVYLIVRSA